MSQPNKVSTPPAATCYRCVHLRYHGSASVRNLVNGKTAIPIHADEVLDPGRYECARFGERITGAEERPEPLVAGGACKEVR